MVVLPGWNMRLRQFADACEALSLRTTSPGSIDEDIVHDRHQPNPHIVSGAKARAFLVSTNQRVVHQVLVITACERPRIAAQARQLAEHIESRFEISCTHLELDEMKLEGRVGKYVSQGVRFRQETDEDSSSFAQVASEREPDRLKSQRRKEEVRRRRRRNPQVSD